MRLMHWLLQEVGLRVSGYRVVSDYKTNLVMTPWYSSSVTDLPHCVFLLALCPAECMGVLISSFCLLTPPGKTCSL